MKRQVVLITALIVCGFGVVQASDGSDNAKTRRQITVQGHGKVFAVPDQARLWVEVNAEGPKQETVTAQVRQKIEAVLKAIRAQGISDKDIQTESYQLSPQFRWDGGRQQRIGYQVSNRVAVVLHDLKKVGSLISATEDAGANSVNGPQYEFENPQNLERKSLQLAMEDAKAKAAVLAQAAGASLGELLETEESGVEFPTPRPMMMMAKAAARAAAVSPPEPISEGEETVSATISASFAIH